MSFPQFVASPCQYLPMGALCEGKNYFFLNFTNNLLPKWANAGDADFEIHCANDVYICNRAAFTHRSPYFQIGASTNTAKQMGRIELPTVKFVHIRAMMHFLLFGTYRGPPLLPNDPHTPYEQGPTQPTESAPQICLDLIGYNKVALQDFPELATGLRLHGDKAVKAITLIVKHELFDANMHTGVEFISSGMYRCAIGAFPQSLQIALYIYLAHVRSRQPETISDPIFHAEMYNSIAIKYMLHDLKPLILSAFRDGVQPWLSRSRSTENPFVVAAKIIVRPLLTHPLGSVSEGDNADMLKMNDVLVATMASNWGWMRHDEEIMRFSDAPKYQYVKDKVEEQVVTWIEEWQSRLSDG